LISSFSPECSRTLCLKASPLTLSKGAAFSLIFSASARVTVAVPAPVITSACFVRWVRVSGAGPQKKRRQGPRCDLAAMEKHPARDVAERHENMVNRRKGSHTCCAIWPIFSVNTAIDRLNRGYHWRSRPPVAGVLNIIFLFYLNNK